MLYYYYDYKRNEFHLDCNHDDYCIDPISGTELNSKYKTTFYKFMNENMKNHDFKFNYGLNIDDKIFHPTRDIRDDTYGFEFCSKESLLDNICHHDKKNIILEVEIPNNANVCEIYDGRFQM